MKYLTLIFFLFPLYTIAQDCKINKETDPFTKETKMSTGFITLQGASVTIDADSKEIDLFFNMGGPDKCFDNTSTASVFFVGTRARLLYHNSGSMNCEGFFHMTFKNATAPNTLLQKLITQKIASIVFSAGVKKETTVKLLPDQQTSFTTMITCLVNEAKTLIK